MKKNILCIDDIKTNLFTLESVLESANEDRYDVFLATSAVLGLDILLKNKIDLILLDIMMPEVDGFEAAKMIKSNRKTKDIPIIFVTAKNDDETIESCYDIGGVDYVNKPFNSTELLNRIEFHLSLVDKENEIHKERLFTQNILDLQDNMIVVSDSKKVIHANNATLEFFGFKSLENFQNSTSCMNELFLEEKGFFSISEEYDEPFWIDILIDRLKENDVVVKMFNAKRSKEYIFTIKATKLNEHYILSFTDISYISQKSKEYEHSANYDNLTQIYNRNMFHRIMAEKIISAYNSDTSFVFVILDIDYFKEVNDTYGHLVGDDVLKTIAALIKKHIRKDDLFARWGGEEFVLSFNVEMQRGLEISEHLRNQIQLHTFEEIGKLTCSFGVTQYIKGEKLDNILLKADKALYEAKSSGRNRVCQF